MSRVPSRHARRVASTPAVAGFRPAALAAAAAFAFQAGAQAQSVPLNVIHGGATFQRNGANLLVTTTNGLGNRSVIRWDTFGVPVDSTTRFQQPDALSTSVNLVRGGLRSDILGTLSSNGRLVLVNPAGIAVGAGAIIDTAGFTASTLDMDDDDAIKGRRLFRGGAGKLAVAEGAKILARGGDVVLVGSQVQIARNAVVQASGATIVAAGETVELTGRGLEGIVMEVKAGNEAVNLGSLKGDAVGIFAHTLKHSGIVQAQAVTSAGGKVVLKAVGGEALIDGTVVASGNWGKGGSIDLLGQRVGLLAGANIDASGLHGGGSIRIGGDYQGKNPDVPNAQAVYVDADATIKADAKLTGDGGRVIVWSDGTTRMDGQISARGGEQGGDGGFAEVSGRGRLEYTGNADLRAARGTTGTLLLDPSNVEIVVNAGTDPSVSYVLESTLETQLATASVIVQAGTGTPDPAGAGITLASDVDVNWSTNNVLGLQADAGINLLGRITGTGANSAVSMQALGGGITQGAAGSVTAFGLKVNAAGDVDLSGANMVQRLSADTTRNGANGDFHFYNGRALVLTQVTTPYGATFDGVKAGTGDVWLNVAAGTVTQGAASTVVANNLSVYADASVTLAGNNSVNSLDGSSSLLGGGGNFSFTNTKSLQVTQVTAGSGDVTLKTTAGSMTVGAPPSVTPAPAVQGNKVTLEAKQDVILQRSVQANGLATINALMGSIRQLSGADVNAASIGMRAGSDIVLDGWLRAPGGIGVTSDNGSITFNTLDASGDNTAATTVDAGDVTLKAKGDISGGTIYANGAYFYGSGEVSGNGGNVNVTSDNGAITLSSVYAHGGQADGWGVGGAAAGTVTLTTKSLSGGIGDIDVGDIDVTGNSGAAATAGGKVFISAAGNLTIGSIDAGGGDGSDGVGGQGGEIHLNTRGTLSGSLVPALLLPASGSFLLDASGGDGGTDTATGNGQRGGKGGLVEITRPSGDLVADSTYFINANGGRGGDAAMTVSTQAGGVGGDGGDVKFIAAGRVELASPLVSALGGDGGYNGDDSTVAASGATGNFRAQGTSVDVTSNLNLGANWINDATVKVKGGSQAVVLGAFQNNVVAELYDTAQLFAINGVLNAGRFTAFGSNVAANITRNTGTLEVAAGSTLSAPDFLSNEGTMKVDGVLRVADAPVLGLQAAAIPVTSSSVFVNQATGTVSGTGSLVVAGGAGTVQNFGTLSPGGNGTTGTLTLDASLSMEAGSVYAADILNTATHDTVVVTGSATSGGTVAVNLLPGATVAAGDTFRILQSASLDTTAMPTASNPNFTAQTSGNDVLLVAAVAPAPVVPLLPPVIVNATQQSNNQVTTFLDLFEQLQKEEPSRIGKDDIVVTDTACTR